MPESNVELARRGYAAALRGELETISELLDPEVQWHGGDPNAPGACHNRRQALKFMRDARLRSGGIGELVDVIAAGDKVVVIMRGFQDGQSGKLSANVTTFRNGKVVEMVHYPDPAEARAAAGV